MLKNVLGKTPRAAVPSFFSVLHRARAGVTAQCHFCHWCMLFDSRGGSKSFLRGQSGNERDVVYVIFPAGGEIRKREGKEKLHASAMLIYCAAESSCRHSCSNEALSSTSIMTRLFFFLSTTVFLKGFLRKECNKIHTHTHTTKTLNLSASSDTVDIQKKLGWIMN